MRPTSSDPNVKISLEIEVDSRPEVIQVPLFCSVSMSHSAYLIRGNGSPSKPLCGHDLANMDVKDGVFEHTREDISRETDNLLGPDKGVYCVVCLCS